MKFIQHYMGERQLLKNVSSMSNVQHGNEESWQSYYKHFNKSLAVLNLHLHPHPYNKTNIRCAEGDEEQLLGDTSHAKEEWGLYGKGCGPVLSVSQGIKDITPKIAKFWIRT